MCTVIVHCPIIDYIHKENKIIITLIALMNALDVITVLILLALVIPYSGNPKGTISTVFALASFP